MDVAKLGLEVDSSRVDKATRSMKRMERQSGKTEGAALRLAKAAADEDFSHFFNGESRWRQTQRILSACVPLDSRGNYQVNQEQVNRLRAYQRVVEACDANGAARPARPPDLPQPPVLADRGALPAVTFAQSEFADMATGDGVVESDNE